MLKLPAIFSDHMVLQRNKNIAVWGESSPGIVTVSLNNCTVETGNFSSRRTRQEALTRWL